MSTEFNLVEEKPITGVDPDPNNPLKLTNTSWYDKQQAAAQMSHSSIIPITFGSIPDIKSIEDFLNGKSMNLKSR